MTVRDDRVRAFVRAFRVAQRQAPVQQALEVGRQALAKGGRVLPRWRGVLTLAEPDECAPRRALTDTEVSANEC